MDECKPLVGGTLNSGSAFVMRATRVGADASLSQIVKLVENAQLAKAGGVLRTSTRPTLNVLLLPRPPRLFEHSHAR